MAKRETKGGQIGRNSALWPFQSLCGRRTMAIGRKRALWWKKLGKKGIEEDQCPGIMCWKGKHSQPTSDEWDSGYARPIWTVACVEMAPITNLSSVAAVFDHDDTDLVCIGLSFHSIFDLMQLYVTFRHRAIYSLHTAQSSSLRGGGPQGCSMRCDNAVHQRSIPLHLRTGGTDLSHFKLDPSH